MAASNGVTKRRQRISENSRRQMHQEVETVKDRPEKKERDPESLNRNKRRRSERFVTRNERAVEEDSSDESREDDHVQHRKSFPSGRIPRHAAAFKVADEMIGVPVPRKARSACIKRSHDCRTSSGSGGGGFGEDHRRHPASPGSYSFEVASPTSSTVSVKQKKSLNGSKSRIPKPPKSSGTIEDDDLEIEIAEVLSGLKKHPLSLKREDDSKNSLKSSEFKGAKKLQTEARIETGYSANIDKSTESPEISLGLIPETPCLLNGVEEKQRLDSKGVLDGPQLENNRDESNCTSKLEFDLMVPPTMPSSPQRVSLLPLASDSIVTKDYCKASVDLGDSSVKSKEKVIAKNEMATEEFKQEKVEKLEWLNLDLERPSQETGRDASLRLENLGWSQPQQVISAQQSSVLPLPVAVEGWTSGLPPQGYVPRIQSGNPVDGSYGSSTLVQAAPFSASQPRPKRCATHFFIARNIQLHQHFLKTNHPSTPNKGSVDLKGGDLRPAAGNSSMQGSSLSLNSQAQEGIPVNISAPKDKASGSGHFASTRQKKSQPPTASSNLVPAPAFIFPTNYHFQPVMVPSQSAHPTKSPCVAVGSASVNFSHPSLAASEASSPYFTVIPNNAYSFQLSSTVRGGTPSQGLPFYNGSYYSPQMFQPAQLLQKQTPVQRESKAASCSSSSHRQLQPQVSVNSLPSQANVQKHRQQLQKSEAKAAGENSDSRGSHTEKGGPYGQTMTASVQPQNFSMSFASFPSGGAAPGNLNFSSNGYHMVSEPPVVHQKNYQASDSKTGGGSCSSNAKDPRKTLSGKPPAMMNGQTLVFDNPSRTLNFVSGTWPPPALTTTNGDPSVFTHHLTQRQQQSGRSKMMAHSQADSVPASSSQWKNPATSSLTSCNSVNLKQFQSQHQISFAVPSKSQPSQGQQGRTGGSFSSVTGSAPPVKAANSKLNNSKALPLSPVPSSSAHAQDQTENSASGSTQKTSPVCGRNVPPIITSCTGHLSELKY
ncbi:unnamed protein product [Arabis nemorensis]|uniref:Protein TIME FOR COFFEE n=1 Tax=Arabis nemorensis TaxID=586526 RepID=A0A565BZ53_9BRAS|nr:unnamed protein product [Arabis nemorensis]